MRPLAEGEFAIRFIKKDLEGWFTKGGTAREGSLDLLFLDGRLDRVLSPGKYTLSNFWQTVLRRGPKKEVVRVRSGEEPLKFILPRLFTADPISLSLECSVVLQLQRGAEQLFYTNLMRERAGVTTLDLRYLIYSKLHDAASNWFGQRELEELVSSPSLADFGFCAGEAVRLELQSKGLRVLREEPENPSCAALDDRTRQLAEALRELWKREGELERRKILSRVEHTDAS